MVPLAWIVDCGVGAWLGHDGFQWPGSGDYFHHLHHKHFDCNYGASHVPMDQLFGTFAGGEHLKVILPPVPQIKLAWVIRYLAKSSHKPGPAESSD